MPPPVREYSMRAMRVLLMAGILDVRSGPVSQEISAPKAKLCGATGLIPQCCIRRAHLCAEVGKLDGWRIEVVIVKRIFESENSVIDW
jgi:hypothetical protein